MPCLKGDKKNRIEEYNIHSLQVIAHAVFKVMVSATHSLVEHHGGVRSTLPLRGPCGVSASCPQPCRGHKPRVFGDLIRSHAWPTPPNSAWTHLDDSTFMSHMLRLYEMTKQNIGVQISASITQSQPDLESCYEAPDPVLCMIYRGCHFLGV